MRNIPLPSALMTGLISAAVLGVFIMPGSGQSAPLPVPERPLRNPFRPPDSLPGATPLPPGGMLAGKGLPESVPPQAPPFSTGAPAYGVRDFRQPVPSPEPQMRPHQPFPLPCPPPAAPPPPASPAASSSVPPLPDTVFLGWFRSGGKKLALFRYRGKWCRAWEGRQFLPGLVLAEIRQDRIVIRHTGADAPKEVLHFRGKTAPGDGL